MQHVNLLSNHFLKNSASVMATGEVFHVHFMLWRINGVPEKIDDAICSKFYPERHHSDEI